MRRRMTMILLSLFLPITAGGQANASDVTLPDYELVELDNGLRLILVEKHDVPLIAAHVRLSGGNLADPEGREGAAEVVAELMQKGAGERGALEFSQAVDSAGGVLSVSTTSEALTVSAEFMSRDQGLMLELLSDLLMRPTLSEDEFDKIRERLIQTIAAAKDNSPNSVIQHYFESFLFGDHPYGRRSDETSLAALSHEDVSAYFRDQVGADRAIMALVGDFDGREMMAELEARFGSWSPTAAAAPSAEDASRRKGRRVLLVDKPDTTQTFFWIGNVGVARDDPDRVALDVANTAFGGRFTSMLNTELRVETGLTYGARSRLIRRRGPGVVAITSYTKTESTEEAIDRALDVLKRLQQEGLSEETLASVKAYVTGLFPLRLETGSQLAARLTEIAFYGLCRSDVDEYASGVQAESVDAIRQVISRVYPPATDLTFVLIGQADAVREVAAKYGDVTEMSITDKRFSPGR